MGEFPSEGARPSSSEQSGNIVGQVHRAIEDGSFFERFKTLKPKERAGAMMNVFNLAHDMQYSDSDLRYKDTQGHGIFAMYPEVFLGPFRKGRRLILEDFQHKWGHQPLGAALHNLSLNYKDQISENGDEAVAHLLLSLPAFVKLEEVGITTIPTLKERIVKDPQLQGLSASIRGEVRRKLTEWESIPEEQPAT